MKRLLVFLFLLAAAPCLAEENQIQTLSNITINDTNLVQFAVNDSPVMEIDMKGTVKINGKLLEKMDTPEIREAMISIAESLSGNQMNCDYLNRQTDYLLEELEWYISKYGTRH